MDCEKALAHAAPYLAGRVEGTLGAELEEHFGSCLSCSRALRSQLALRKAMKENLPEPAGTPENLRESISICVRCMEDPGRTSCPRLRRRFRLVQGSLVM